MSALTPEDLEALDIAVDEAETCLCCGDTYGWRHIIATVERIVTEKVAAAKAEAGGPSDDAALRRGMVAGARQVLAAVAKAHVEPDDEGEMCQWLVCNELAAAREAVARIKKECPTHVAEALAEAWEHGRMAERVYLEAIHRVRHWSYIGTEKPVPPSNPYLADRIGGTDA